MAIHKDTLRDAISPSQLGMAVSDAIGYIYTVIKHPLASVTDDFIVCLKLNIRNAFNTVSRQ